jgi:hypothetical protein
MHLFISLFSICIFWRNPGIAKVLLPLSPSYSTGGWGRGRARGAVHFFLNFNLLLFLQNVKPKTFFYFYGVELGNTFSNVYTPAPRSRSQFSVKPRFLLYTFYVLIKAGPQRKYREGRKGR